MLTACDIIYNASTRPVYGEVEGVCRITGKKGKGLGFQKWVKKTFTDHAYLYPGDIVCNEALFTFDEASEELRQKTGKEKLQRFRTYSHIVCDGEWKAFTKGDKQEIFDYICKGAEIVILADTGQKHLAFKHRIGYWQLEELHIEKDLDTFKHIHKTAQELMRLGFNQTSIIEGQYNSNYVLKNGFEKWKPLEDEIKKYRGTPIFQFATWMLFV